MRNYGRLPIMDYYLKDPKLWEIMVDSLLWIYIINRSSGVAGARKPQVLDPRRQVVFGDPTNIP